MANGMCPSCRRMFPSAQQAIQQARRRHLPKVSDLKGCLACFATNVDQAWKSSQAFTQVAVLLDESHCRLRLLACPRCGQRSVSVFTEMISWIDGDDDQRWMLVPISENEARQLTDMGEAAIAALPALIGASRQHVLVEHPGGGPKTIVWSKFFWVGPHS
jgi:hypothetical protein